MARRSSKKLDPYPLLGRISPATLACIMDLVKTRDNHIRKRQLSDEYVLNEIIRVVQHGMPWHQIVRGWSSVYKRFMLWTKLGIFRDAWRTTVKSYQDHKLANDPKAFVRTIIDASMIGNQRGEDCTGRNHYDRYRQGTKLSMIIDVRNIPIGYVLAPANVHDVKLVERTVESIPGKLRNDQRHVTTLIGDIGYLMLKPDKRRLFRNHRVRLVAPFKRNSKVSDRKKRDTLKECIGRYTIEHIFCRFDKFRRIRTRYERKIEYYESMLQIGLLINMRNIV